MSLRDARVVNAHWRHFPREPEEYHLIITDQVMPRLSGDNLVAIVREINRNIPILIMSGFTDRITPGTTEGVGGCRIDDQANNFRRTGRLQLAESSGRPSTQTQNNQSGLHNVQPAFVSARTKGSGSDGCLNHIEIDIP